MAKTFVQFDNPVRDTAGSPHIAKVCGREREDGLWEGWIEFENMTTGETLHSTRETTQPNSDDLAYWATGLSEVYLEGALARTQKTPGSAVDPIAPPAFDAPAQRAKAPRHSAGHAILDPFSVYEKGADLLARELMALQARHLKQIIKEYQLTGQSEAALDSLTEPELGALILSRMRELHA